MTHNQNITHRHYQQLQSAERSLIMRWLDQGNFYREIARRLGHNVATISREVKRGQVIQIGYNHKI